MKKIFYMIFLVGFFQGQANAQPDFSYLTDIQPNPAIEGQMVTIGFVVGCRNWTDHNFSVNGFIIDYQVTYHPCVIGVPPPEGFMYLDLEVLPVGNYQLNLNINTGSPPVQYQEIINFGVLPIQQVPLNSRSMYLLLGSLLLLTGGVYHQRSSSKLHVTVKR